MFKLTTKTLSPHSLYIRCVKIIVLSSPIVASYFYSYSKYTSSFSCPILSFTGIPCPGCGLTRSFLSFAKGDILSSFSYHLLGPFLFIFFILTTIHIFLEIVSKKQVKSQYSKLLRNKNTQYLILFSILIYYWGKLFFLYSVGDLTSSFESSPLANLIYH